MRKILVVLMLVGAACTPAGREPAEPPEAADQAVGQEDTTTTTEAAREPLLVVVSTSIWGNVVANVGGDDVRVEVVIPVGVDAHDFQPSAQQARLMAGADLVVVNGLHLEEGLLDLVASLEADGVEVLEIGELLDPIPLRGDHGHEDDDHDHGHEDDNHDHGNEDPHVWFDPVRMARGAEIIAERLSRIDPERADEWAAPGAAYRDRILEVHEEVEAILSVIPPERRKLVTNHDALGYFAERYGFEVVGTVIPGGATLAEPSARELAALVGIIREEEVPAIFGETTDPSVLAEAVAAEVGHPVEVVLLYTESLGLPGSGAETYLDMLVTNARLIAEALS